MEWYLAAAKRLSSTEEAHELFLARNVSRGSLYVQKRALTRQRLRGASAARTRQRAADAVPPCDSDFTLASRPVARLQPTLFPDRPDVSFVLQYERQPDAIAPLVAYYHSCTRGMQGAEQARRAGSCEMHAPCVRTKCTHTHALLSHARRTRG